MEIDKKRETIGVMFSSIARRYDILNTILSLGICHYWRYRFFKMIRLEFESAINQGKWVILDLASGTGANIPALQDIFANNRLIAADLSVDMLAVSKVRYQNKREQVEFLLAAADQLPLENDSIDLCTITFGIRNFENLATSLDEVSRVLKKDGKLVVMEFGQPANIIWRQIFNIYSNIVLPFIGGLVSGNKEAYYYLQQTAKSFPCGEELVRLVEARGYRTVSFVPLSGGIVFIYYFEKAN